MIQEIQSFVRIGDLMGLNKYLTVLEVHNPQFRDIVRQLMLLGKEFRLTELKKIINLTAEKCNDDEQKTI